MLLHADYYCNGVAAMAIDLETPTGDGFFVSGHNLVPVNTEIEIIRFVNVRGRPLRLATLAWGDAWLGSPSGRLYIRADGATVEPYFRQWTHDAEPLHFQQRLRAVIPAGAVCTVSFFSETDTGNDRPIWMAIAGWYLLEGRAAQ